MAKKSRFFRARKPRVSAFTWLLRLTAVAMLGWTAGLAAFTAMVWLAVPPSPIPHADGIVALTGGDDRVGTALALLAARDAPALLISGAGRTTQLGDLTADDKQAATQYAAHITLGHLAATTRGNALETAIWAQTHHMSSLLIVTADYHMPRALLVIRQRLPGTTLIPIPVRPPAMTHILSAPTFHLLAAEYTKYLLARAGLDRLADESGAGQ